jgi:hypothetical protein
MGSDPLPASPSPSRKILVRPISIYKILSKSSRGDVFFCGKWGNFYEIKTPTLILKAGKTQIKKYSAAGISRTRKS